MSIQSKGCDFLCFSCEQTKLQIVYKTDMYKFDLQVFKTEAAYLKTIFKYAAKDLSNIKLIYRINGKQLIFSQFSLHRFVYALVLPLGSL